jgi:LDH2 family malate/lactate/ureidoglycolate dehydrogenase
MAETRYDPIALIDFAAMAFRFVGVPGADAALVADSLVRANMRGHASHGIFRLPWYVERIRRGVMEPVTWLEPVRDGGVVTVLSANDGVGQVAAMRAMQLAIERARNQGAAVVGVRRSNHFGAAMYFTLEAARHGCVGIITTNASPGLAPWGGKRATLGNNPWSIAAPAGSHPPLILDIANSVVARGKIYTARQEGREIPLGWAIDQDGNPTTDPAAALAGLILPIGGHKGYAISFMIDVLSGVLTGSNFATDVFGPYQAEKRSGCGHLIIVLNIEHFMGLGEFNERVEQLIHRVKGSPLAPGSEEIFYPGEPEARAEADALRNGVPLADETAADLRRFADELGIEAPF